MIRKLCDRVSCGRKFFRFRLKQWILAKFLCDRVYFWAIFYATGYRVWRALPHTPVTSLVKYPPPPPGVKSARRLHTTQIRSRCDHTYNEHVMEVPTVNRKFKNLSARGEGSMKILGELLPPGTPAGAIPESCKTTKYVRKPENRPQIHPDCHDIFCRALLRIFLCLFS